MPLFEYSCRACGSRFEYLTRGQQQPACPSCASADLDKQLSVFAVGAAPTTQPRGVAGPCGTCGDPRGPGACSMN